MSTVLVVIVPVKNVSMPIHGEQTVRALTNICNAQHAATFRLFFLGTENRQFCCLALVEHIALLKRRDGTTKLETISIFEEVSTPIAISHTGTFAKKSENGSNFDITVLTPY